ncbi:MAG TPA: MBL fold metallo-hydrolase [Desulfobulbaceae bacterium]|nr:MBL fold metallo-hydrolase [Desulfobulbaceae bacterium]
MLLLIVFICSPLQAGAAEQYSIERVTGNVYRFINDRHRSVFLVTKNGILITDPMNREAATWLNNEIRKRFKLPVRYVIYSHNHSDHVYGGSVFKDARTVFISSSLARQDLKITHADTVLPDITFQRKMSVFLGENRIELRYHGPNDGRGSISMLFQPEKVLYVVDWIVVGRMPWRKLWSYDIQGMINSTRDILTLDFDTFVGGHGDIGTKADVREYLAYLEDLYSAVIGGIRAGKTLDQLKKEIRLPRYSRLRHYKEWLPMNIEGVYERLMEESGMGWRPKRQH